ncbi:hypothetical protein GCM10009672_22660 [Nesterenkonia lutea]
MRGPGGPLLVLAGVTAMMLSSCAEDPGGGLDGDPGGGTDAGADGDQSTGAPAAVHPDADGDDPSGGGSVSPDLMPAPLQETPEMVAEHLSAWQNYTVVSDTELQLSFYTGNPACYGVRSVVEEDEEVIRVATISGTLLDAVDSACTQEARHVSLIVELDEPVADREVVPLAEVELNR